MTAGGTGGFSPDGFSQDGFPPSWGGAEAPTATLAPPPTEARRGDGAGDLRFAAAVAGVLVVVGALLGLLWSALSPPGPIAIIYSDGAILPDENENFIGADGRFVIIVAIVGLVSGLAAWRFVRRRGVVTVVGLALGSVLGSLATWLIGYLTGGGDGTGAVRELTDGTRVHYSKQLPITVHAHGLLFVQASIAVLVYALFVAFTNHDDLGRPDPLRARLQAARPQPSVDPGDQPQGGWGDRNAPGTPQQGDLPAQ